jgi:hypothetical protein
VTAASISSGDTKASAQNSDIDPADMGELIIGKSMIRSGHQS